jgi:hypothetical protein
MKWLVLLLFPVIVFSQDTIPAIPLQPLIKSSPVFKPVQADRYVLYPTDNAWTHLMLNTASGLIWQVQWHTDSEYRFTTLLNGESLVPDDEGKDDKPTGRFKLYPTKNTYNFLLLDHDMGRTWQVQWNNDADKRFIEYIY